jgi:small subunit ribosomal protein S5
VVNIRRVAKTVAGGRRFTFTALVIVGDGQGTVGMGQGRASEVPEAIRKGALAARKHMIKIPLSGSTIPQQVTTRFCGARVLLRPARPGTGLRAGATVRAVVEAAGVRDILSKSLGSNNHINVVRATMHALQSMRPVQQAGDAPPPVGQPLPTGGRRSPEAFMETTEEER